MFDAKKRDPVQWLGPDNTPGTPEHSKRQSWAKNIFKKATGLDIDDARSFEQQAVDSANFVNPLKNRRT